MKVSLIHFTGKGASREREQRVAAELLAFTKSTRLNMHPGLLEEIQTWPDAKLHAELDYMAGTIPSSWEMVDYTFLVEGVSRAYTHQQVRTRAASYAQQTLRVLDVSGGFDYVYTERNLADPRAQRVIEGVLSYIAAAYRTLAQDFGQPPEDARGILPTNIATNIVCKFNLRTLSELARSRTGGRTQGEYQRVINAMIDAVLAVHPWAEKFLFARDRNYFDELEAAIKAEWPDDLLKRGRLLKIVDAMRKAA